MAHQTQIGTQLRFGDCVVLYGYQDRKASSEEKQASLQKGLMTCQGYGQDQVYFEAFNIKLTDDNETKVWQIKNYRDCVFQIWPKLDFEAHKEYKKLNKNKAHIEKKKKIQEEEVEDEKQLANEQQEQYYNDIIDKLKKVRQRCSSEKTSNFDQIEQARGKLVSYGQEIFFMHLDSRSFLNGQVSSSSSDQSAYRFELSYIFNRGMTFKIQPRYKLRQEGEPIQYKDNVLILNVKLNSFVNFNTINPIPLDKPIPQQEKPYYRQIDMQRSLNRQRYECYVSNMTEATWQILFFRSLPDQEIYHIMGQQLIYLKHAETQGYLSADLSYKSDKGFAECYVRLYEGDEEEEKDSVYSIWEVEFLYNYSRGEEFILSTKTTNLKTGQVLSEPNKFILRHFITGKVLSSQEVNLEGKKMLIPCLCNDDKQLTQANCGIQFITTSGEDKEMMENNICYILAMNNQQLSVDTSLQYSIPLEQKGKQQKAQEHIEFFKDVTEDTIYKPLKDIEYDTVRYGVLCEDKGTQEENAFQILRVENDICEDIFKVQSQICVLQRYAALIKGKQNEFKTSKDIVRQAQRALTQLIFFVSNTTLEPSVENALKCEGVPIPQRQRIVRDFRLIELLTDILYYPFRLELIPLEKVKEFDEEVIRIFLLAYKCLTLAIKEYKPSELYASQWLELLIKQAKMTVDNGDIGAEEALTELIDNNRRILETKISSTTIRSFMDMLYDEREDKYVKMVYALCVCDDAPMIFNQAEVSETLLLDQDFSQTLVYPLQKDGNRILIKPYPDEEAFELLLFKEKSQERDNLKHFNYFLEMLLLYSGLCLGRNYIALDVLSQMYPLDLCHKVVSTPEYPLTLRKNFVKLLQHLWIDRAPYSRLVLPDRIRIWNEIDKKDDTSIPCTEHNFSQLQPLKNFILYELEQDVLRGYSQIFAVEKNDFIYEVLSLLKLQMEFGFYMNIEEITSIMKPLMKKIESVYDVTTEEEEEELQKQLAKKKKQKKSKENASQRKLAQLRARQAPKRFTSRYDDLDINVKMHQIKRILCEIMNYIVKLRESTRASYVLNEFKKDQLAIENLVANKSKKDKVKIMNSGLKVPPDDIGLIVDAAEYAVKPLAWISYLLEHKRINFMVGEVDLTLNLMDLTLYKCDALVNMSFEFIHQLYYQRMSIVNTINEIQLLEDPLQIKIYQQIQSIGITLAELVEKSEQWMWKTDQKRLNQANQVIQYLETIAQSLVTQFKEKNIFDEPDGEIIPIQNESERQKQIRQKESSKLTQLFGEGEESNGFAQDLLRNVKIYENVLTLLRFDAEQFTYKRSQGDAQFFDPKNPSHKVLQLCYLILGRFCYLCSENQTLLLPSLQQVFLKHLKYINSVDQHLMLEPFLHDNKAILQDEHLFQLFLHEITRTINGLPLLSNLKPSYFKCLLELTKIKGKVMKNNQTTIINEITHRDYPDIVVTYQEDIAKFKKEVDELQSQIDQVQPSGIVVQSQLDYFNSFVHLMAIICEDKNNATESKTQNYFPITHLSKLMEISDRCWYIMKNLMLFFYHVYLDTEREMTDELIDIKKNLIIKVKQDLQHVSESIGSQQGYLMTYKGTITLSDVKLEYYFNALLLNVETIIKKRMIEDVVLRDEFHLTLIKSLYKVSTEIEATNYKYRQIIKNTFALLIGVNAINEDELKGQLPKDLYPTSAQIHSAKMGQGSVQSYIKEVRDRHISMKEEKLKNRMIILLKREDFKDIIREEMNKLIENISNIEERTRKEFRGACTIPFEELIEAMIAFTQKNSKKDVQLTVLRLQIFRRIIEKQNSECNKDITEWENEDYSKCAIEIKRAQNQMVQYGIVGMLYSLMMDENQHKDIIEECINLSIGLLLGGNKTTQEAFLSEMTKDNSNAFFIRIKERLERGFDQVKKTMSLFNKKLFEQLLTGSNLSKEQKEQKELELDLEDQEIQTFEGDIENEDIEEEDKDSMLFVTRILRLLQLFCEGHNLNLQEYLRQQVINQQVLGRNHDFIYNSAVQLANLVKFVNVHSVQLGHQLMDFIIESIQGPCSGNQTKLVSAKVIDTCKDLMVKFQVKGAFAQLGFNTEDQVQQMEGLVTKATKLLISLIEGKSDQYILDSLCQSLDFDLLLERLKEQYFQMKKRFHIQESFNNMNEIIISIGDIYDEQAMESFQIFILIKTLQPQSQYIQKVLDELESPECEDKAMSETVEFFNTTTKSIEINFKDELITIYFPVQPICRFLSKNTRTRIMTEVSRESPNEKIAGLTEEAEGVFDEMDHMAYLNSLPFNFSQNRLNTLRDLSTFLSFIINLMILFTYHKSLDPTDSEKQINEDSQYGIPVQEIMNILGYIQLCTSCLMLLFWVFIHSHLLLTIKWRNFIEEKQRLHVEELYLLDKYENAEDIQPDDLPVQLTLKLLYLKGPSIPLFNKGLFKNFGHPYTLLMYSWQNFTFIFGDGNVKYFFFYITVSFIGTFIHEIAYCLHLLDVIGRFPQLQNVIKAITTNSWQLLLTSILGLILIYIWAIIGFYFLDDNFSLPVYDDQGVLINENECTTLLQCFVISIDNGLIAGGGFGDFLLPMSYNSENAGRYAVRWVYDVFFFMVVKMAFLNIIFGIIIDSFAELRDNRKVMEEDMSTICFICGIERDKFDQFADGFENHIERDHHLWNYLYYIYHLRITNPTDYNGIESEVYDKFIRSEEDWFPILKARTIEKAEEEEDDETKLNVELDLIKDAVKNVNLSIERLNKQLI